MWINFPLHAHTHTYIGVRHVKNVHTEIAANSNNNSDKNVQMKKKKMQLKTTTVQPKSEHWSNTYMQYMCVVYKFIHITLQSTLYGCYAWLNYLVVQRFQRHALNLAQARIRSYFVISSIDHPSLVTSLWTHLIQYYLLKHCLYHWYRQPRKDWATMTVICCCSANVHFFDIFFLLKKWMKRQKKPNIEIIREKVTDSQAKNNNR